MNHSRACRFVFPRVFGRNHNRACRFDPKSRALRTATKYGARVSIAQLEAVWLCQATTHFMCFLKVQLPLLIFATMRPDDHHHACHATLRLHPKALQDAVQEELLLAQRQSEHERAAGQAQLQVRRRPRTQQYRAENGTRLVVVTHTAGRTLGTGRRRAGGRGGGSRFFSGSLSLLQNLDHTNFWSKGGIERGAKAPGVAPTAAPPPP